MMHQPGSYVYPADLPRRVLCRVASADTRWTASGAFQILELVPLEGPWRGGTRLVRLDDAVIPTEPRGLWRAYSAPASPPSAGALRRHAPEAEAWHAVG